MNGNSEDNHFDNNPNMTEEFISVEEAYEPDDFSVSEPLPENAELEELEKLDDIQNFQNPTTQEILEPSAIAREIPVTEPTIPDNAPHKSGRGKLAAGLFGGLVGLLAGGVAVYAGFVLTKTPLNCADNSCAEAPIDIPTTSVSDSSFDFLKLETAGQNLIYSPLSIRSGLALLSAGAAGETKTEIDNIIGDSLVPKYANIADKLSFANAVFIRNDFQDEVLDSYISAVTTNNNADIIFDSFENSDTLDTWASEKTFGLINNLGIMPNELTQMVLANALAIQMDWRYAFDEPYDDSFYLADGEEATVSTLHQTFSAADVTYYQDDDATVVTLPLDSGSDTELEFAAIMPTTDLGTYIDAFDMNQLDALLDSTIPASDSEGGIYVSIPKFQFDYELDFMADLEVLGMTTAFTDAADFSNLASIPLSVGAAVHKANIEFTETGIRAAAVTSFAMDVNAMLDEPEPVFVTIDHPFLFVIRDRDNGAIWFTGTVYTPSI